MDKPSNKDKDLAKKQEAKGAKTESVSSEPESVKDERKHWRKCVLVGVFFFFAHTHLLWSYSESTNECLLTCPPPFPGPKSPGKMGMTNFRKGDPNFFRPKPFRRGPYFEKVTPPTTPPPRFGTRRKWSDDIQKFSTSFFQPFVNMNLQRRPKSLIPPEEVWNSAPRSLTLTDLTCT